MSDIVFEPELKPESRAAVLEGLVAFNRSRTPDFTGSSGSIGLLIKDPETGATVGGLTARFGFDWMFVDLLFVPEHRRAQGTGRKLMEQLEAVARDKGCVGIYLDTFSFQALGFYEKLGYSVFGEIADFPAGHSRFFLHKYLG